MSDGTTPDHAVGLQWAAAFREFRTGLAASLSDGSRTLANVLGAVDEDDLLAETKLQFVLESLPGARKTDTRRELDRLGLGPLTRLGALDESQRSVLLATFPLPVGAAGAVASGGSGRFGAEEPA